MPRRRSRNCGKFHPAADELTAGSVSTSVEGCRGGSLVGADFLRDVTQMVTSVIASNTTIASFTKTRPAFGFPAITGQL